MNPRNCPPIWYDQSGTPLLGGDVTRPRPGRLTEYERRESRRLRLGDWLPVVVVAVAMLVCLFLYNLPVMLGWLEPGL